MRLIDADELLERIEPYNTSDKMDKALYNFAYNKITECPNAKLEDQAEQLKTDLRKILNSYSTPRFINVAEIDVDKFKEAMSKAQLRAMPSEDKFDKFCQLYENWKDGKRLEVRETGRIDIKYAYPSYISIDDVNRLIAIVKKGECHD